MHTVNAIDEVSDLPGRWRITRDTRVSKRLSSHVAEVQQLKLWDGAYMRFTSNVNDRGISNGRLCYVEDSSHAGDLQTSHVVVRLCPRTIDIS
ncbi:unnamed protein product [Vitrella brassicaformis CCMP3155]|uniref:Uncharacterized protein n=1 Tax=Vitrella brassicaformis (strain CCMP3155) TaxID=1169540 RepID=A0A0G4E8J6_VITBC|nr:unnamed protein product [Vitrella brassicaformis CCMP3155]|mmetsp:Transcript_30257/g.75153  ORF Transcript_30257/g.75153 Transcript_30257/m.75153 type:complete len:93 (+) Transcript_30257:2977-3255(+)|eukprot:CEL91667.1 unnamed protein product [Vitrella brassicaformis CCMP3155]